MFVGIAGYVNEKSLPDTGSRSGTLRACPYTALRNLLIVSWVLYLHPFRITRKSPVIGVLPTSISTSIFPSTLVFTVVFSKIFQGAALITPAKSGSPNPNLNTFLFPWLTPVCTSPKLLGFGGAYIESRSALRITLLPPR